MTANKEISGGRRWRGRRKAGWATAALILLVPLLAMQVTDEVNWDVADFVIFGALLVGAGVTYEAAVRTTGNTVFRIGAGVAILAAFLLVWINGAVGIIGNEDNDANLMYFGVLLIALIGVIVSRFKPLGMARAMIATAGAQLLVFGIAVVAGWGFTGPITILFVGMWLVSAQLFRRAAAEILSENATAKD